MFPFPPDVGKLHMAITLNRNDEVRRALSTDDEIDVNLENHGSTPLMLAVEFDNVTVAKMLLAHKRIDVNLTTGIVSPLLTSIAGGKKEIFSMLLKHKHIDVNKTITNADDFVLTPLLTAVHYGKSWFVDQLLRHPSIDVSLECNGGNVLTAAVTSSKECRRVVDLLLGQPRVNVNQIDADTGRTPLCQAIDMDDEEEGLHLLKALLRRNDLNVNQVCLEVDWDIELDDDSDDDSDDGSDGDSDVGLGEDVGETALMAAILQEKWHMFECLLADPRIDVNVYCPGGMGGSSGMALGCAMSNTDCPAYATTLLRHHDTDVQWALDDAAQYGRVDCAMLIIRRHQCQMGSIGIEYFTEALTSIRATIGRGKKELKGGKGKKKMAIVRLVEAHVDKLKAESRWTKEHVKVEEGHNGKARTVVDYR